MTNELAKKEEKPINKLLKISLLSSALSTMPSRERSNESARLSGSESKHIAKQRKHRKIRNDMAKRSRKINRSK
jgi:hypothetical protein